MDEKPHPPRQPYLFQPVKTLTPYSFTEVMEEVRSTFFPEIEQPVEVRIVANGPLAFISPHHMGRDRHMVAFHPILNHPDTPIEIVRLIAKHELAHTRVPSGLHTSEFWEIEFAIGPERYAVWHWINESLRGATRNGSGFRVFKTWRRHFKGPRAPYTPHLPLDPERYEGICPGDGQMMLPPDWVRKPLPMAPLA